MANPARRSRCCSTRSGSESSCGYVSKFQCLCFLFLFFLGFKFPEDSLLLLCMLHQLLFLVLGHLGDLWRQPIDFSCCRGLWPAARLFALAVSPASERTEKETVCLRLRRLRGPLGCTVSSSRSAAGCRGHGSSRHSGRLPVRQPWAGGGAGCQGRSPALSGTSSASPVAACPLAGDQCRV